MAELAASPGERASVLARHGLDEARWEAVDAHFQEQLSEAMGATDDDSDDVHPLIVAYTQAYEAAQLRLSNPISIETFAEVTRLLNATGDLRASLARAGVTLADYVAASGRFMRQMPEDPALFQRFEDAVKR